MDSRLCARGISTLRSTHDNNPRMAFLISDFTKSELVECATRRQESVCMVLTLGAVCELRLAILRGQILCGVRPGAILPLSVPILSVTVPATSCFRYKFVFLLSSAMYDLVVVGFHEHYRVSDRMILGSVSKSGGMMSTVRLPRWEWQKCCRSGYRIFFE